MATGATFEEAMQGHEHQARKPLGATVVLLEQDHRELRNKEASYETRQSQKRHEFFLQSIGNERK